MYDIFSLQCQGQDATLTTLRIQSWTTHSARITESDLAVHRYPATRRPRTAIQHKGSLTASSWQAWLHTVTVQTLGAEVFVAAMWENSPSQNRRSDDILFDTALVPEQPSSISWHQRAMLDWRRVCTTLATIFLLSKTPTSTLIRRNKSQIFSNFVRCL